MLCDDPEGSDRRGGGKEVHEGEEIVQSLSRVDFLRPPGLQHARLFCPPLSPGACSKSCPLSQ